LSPITIGGLPLPGPLVADPDPDDELLELDELLDELVLFDELPHAAKVIVSAIATANVFQCVLMSLSWFGL
jgi:hypothetical protein